MRIVYVRNVYTVFSYISFYYRNFMFLAFMFRVFLLRTVINLFCFCLFVCFALSMLSTFSIYMLHFKFVCFFYVSCSEQIKNSPAVGNHAKHRPFAFGRLDLPAMATYIYRYHSNPFHPIRFEHQLSHLTCNMLHVMWSTPYLNEWIH